MMPSDYPVEGEMAETERQINTLDDVRRRVAQIATAAKADLYGFGADHEVLHGDEDQLWADVLAAIAAERIAPAEAARIALETRDLDFTRWYS